MTRSITKIPVKLALCPSRFRGLYEKVSVGSFSLDLVEVDIDKYQYLMTDLQTINCVAQRCISSGKDCCVIPFIERTQP